MTTLTRRPPRNGRTSASRGRVRAAAVVSIVLFGVPALSPDLLSGQSLAEELRTLTGPNAEAYLRPLSDGLAFALTGGLFDSPRARRALSFDLGIRALGARPSDSVREFVTVLPDTLRWQPPQGPERLYSDPYQPSDGSLRSPSALGEGPGIVLEPAGNFREDLVASGLDPDDFRLHLPSGLDLRVVPTAMLSLAVGVGFDTEISGRYLPTVEVNSEIGRVGARGWGVQHTVSRWFASPLDISIGIARQELEIGELVDANASEGWVLVGGALGPVTLFGTAGIRSASVDVEYAVANPGGIPGIPADGTLTRFSSDLDTTTAFGGGFRLQLLFMNLSGLYTTGDFDTFSVKVGLGTP